MWSLRSGRVRPTWCSAFAVASMVTWGRSYRTLVLATISYSGLPARCWATPSPDLPPFRAVAFPELLALRMDDRNWGWTLQMQIRAVRAGLRIVEVEVSHRRRSEGVSKISGNLATSLQVGAKMFYTLARERLR